MTVINDSVRYISYVCPVCSEISEKYINFFDFASNSPLEFSCDFSDCGEACFSISRIKDKFKIVIECPACGEVHTFKISLQNFLLKDLITFACPESGVNIFFAGKKTKVKKALADNAQKLFELTEQFDLFTEEVNLMYNIIDKLNSMINKKKILCSSCGSTDVIPDVDQNGIGVFCKHCDNHISLNIDDSTLDILEEYGHFEF